MTALTCHNTCILMFASQSPQAFMSVCSLEQTNLRTKTRQILEKDLSMTWGNFSHKESLLIEPGIGVLSQDCERFTFHGFADSMDLIYCH